ncbi:MAG: universal stress protein [Leptolyngbyaceae bacterium]|nr:universal stress protein [Leptolyngbyaceae bacterium]
MFQNALVCTDFEDGLYRLVNFVPNLAAGGLRQITFVHTVSLIEDREFPRIDHDKEILARERLSVALESVPEGVSVHVDVQSAKPSDHIMRAVKQFEPDVIILGTPSRSRLTEQVFGSTTQALCRQLNIPVMILRPQLISSYMVDELALRCERLFQYMLVPYDGSHSADYLIESLKKRVQEASTSTLKRCLLCWVIEEGGRRSIRSTIDYQMEEAEEKLATVKADLEALGVDVQTFVTKGNVFAEVLNLAIENDISAIAIASDSMGKLIEWSIPSFAGDLVRQSWHPVIYFPSSR